MTRRETLVNPRRSRRREEADGAGSDEIRLLTSAATYHALVALALLLASLAAQAQGPPLLREAISRELVIHAGGEPTLLAKEAVSRELSVFVGENDVPSFSQAVSRALSVVVTTPAVPARVSELTVAVSPTGDRAILDWSGYNEIAQSDVVRYRIYISTTPFTTVSNLAPFAILPAETFSLTVSNLTPFQDHYFAVVAEDALGGSDPVVDYSAAYVLAPEVITREFSLFVGGNSAAQNPEAISRAVTVVITTPAVPARVSELTINVTPTGDSATLDWRAYNENLQRDVVRYDIYVSTQPFTTVSNRTPFTSIPAETALLTISNLTPYVDHYFAVVAVDALGGFDPVVDYSAAYVLAPEVVTREFSLFVGGNSAAQNPEAISRAVTVLVPDSTVPDPVTGVNSGFEAATSLSAFSAIDLNWSSYNEVKQGDVVRYRVYVGPTFFTNVTGITPYSFAPAGTPLYTVQGLLGGNIYYVAVVAEDAGGNWNPTVRAISAKASVGALGEVQHLAATSFSNSLQFTWSAPEEVDAFLAHYNVYFGGNTNPVALGSTATVYSASGLLPATGYPFRISTVDTFNTESAGVSLLAATWLDHPGNLAAQPFDGMVRLTWTHAEPNELVGHYAVYRSGSNFTSVAGSTPVFTTRETRADVTGLINGSSNFFAVTTVNIVNGEKPAVQTVAAIPNPVPGNFADLKVTSVSGPTSVYSGQTVNLGWSVTNSGTGGTSTKAGTPVNSWVDRLVLSPDAVFGDADDVLLADVPHAGSLAAGGVYPGNATVQIPTNLLGNFYLFVLADVADAVYEHLDAGTNLGVAAQPIVIGPPSPPIITQQPSSLAVFEGRTASFSVVAQGSPPLAFQWRRNGAPLPGRTTASLTLSNVQPSDAGNYSVTITNIAGTTNSTAATLTVLPPPPDLSALSISAPASLVAGQPVPISWVVTNSGLSAANPQWQEKLLLANNPAGNNAAPLFTFTSSNALAASNSAVRSPTVIFPSGLSGNYWLAVQVDSADAINEDYGETNNYFVAPQPFSIQSPDLRVSFLNSPASAVFGQSFAVNWSVTNSGTGPSLVSWSDKVWLSTASNSLAGATLLATHAAAGSPLATNASYATGATVTVPLTAESLPGFLWLIVQADADGVQPESNENNNLLSTPLSLTLPPLPDLAVVNVSGPSNALPGQMIAFSWAVTNRGSLAITGAWAETVFLATNSTGGGLVELATFTYSNSLPVGGSITRTEQVFVPVASPLGSLWLAVQADSLADVVEGSELNNLGVASNATVIPAVLTLQVSPAQVSEGAAQPVLATVTRNGPRTAPLTVTIANSDPTELSTPVGVVIPAGQASVPFSPISLTDGIVDGPQIVTLGASAPGFAPASRQITVLDVDLPHLSIILTTNTVIEGAIFTATISRDAGTNQPVTVLVNGSSPSQLAAPQPVTIPAGQFSAPLNLIAFDDPLIEAPAIYTLNATADGYLPGVANVTVLDNDLPVVTLTIAPNTVSESGGIQAALATLTRNPASARALELELQSSNTNVVRVPPHVSIPAAEAIFTFPVAVVDNAQVDGPKNVQIRVWIRGGISGERLAEVPPGTLTVTDDDGPTLTLTIDRSLVAEGVSNAANATVTRNTGTNGALVVNLSSGNTNEITVPPTVTIPAGAISANFALASINDGLTDGNKLVTLTATASNYTAGTAQITVSDVNLPDLVVSAITAPASVETEAFANLGYALRNQGLVTMASNTILQRIYLSPDPFVGDDILMGQFAYNGPLTPGNEIGQTFQLRMPQAAGDYWVVVETDVENAAPEILEDNNKRISDAPIHVAAAYAATVSTTLNTAPSGTPVPLTGHAFKPATGGPAPFALVNIHIKVRGTRRIIAALTDAAGNFATTWQPLPGEAGFYEIAAAHPGDADPVTQDTFTLFGMKAVPNAVSLSLIEQDTKGGLVQIQNAGEVPLTGLAVQIINPAANLNFTATLATNALGSLASNSLSYSVTALSASVPQAQVIVRVTSAEGATLDVPFTVNVAALLPRLVAVPAELNSGMKRGAQTLVNFQVANLGGATSGPVTISLPPLPWMSLVTPSPLPPLEPGKTNDITLQLMPPADLPLTLYTGNLVLSSTGAQLSVPFQFRALSDAKGDLRVISVDEFTYFAAGSPRLTNAAVTVKDSVSGKVVTNGVTGTNGEFHVPQLAEGYYDLELTADQHANYRATHLLLAGVTNDITAFLSRQTVRYTWTVEPTEIQDHYRISVETVFEANVPAPVITVDPPVIEVGDLTTVGQVKQINMTISNHGLIAVDHVHLGFSDHPAFEIKPLVEDLGHLNARSSLTVPVTIRRTAVFARPGLAARDAGPVCSITGGATYDFICGPITVKGGAAIAVSGVHGDCPGGAVFVSGGGGGGGGIVPVGGGVSVGIKIVCDPRCLILAALGCIPGPIGCFFSGWSCGESIASNSPALAAADCLIGAAGCLIPGAGIPACMYSLARCFINPARPEGDWPRPPPYGLAARSTDDLIDQFEPGIRAFLDGFNILTGAPDGVWINAQANSDTGEWYARFRSAANPASDGGRNITAAERAALLTGVQPPGVSAAEINRFLDRWNRTLANWGLGIFTHAQAPLGANLDFIDADALRYRLMIAGEYQRQAEAAGFTDPFNAIVETVRFRDAQGESGGVCARVRLRIDQEAVISREAFRATLEFDNTGGSTLGAIRVIVRATDSHGHDTTSLFGIAAPELAGISDVNGGGMVPPGGHATARWTIIPTVDAAPLAPVQYFVSGELRYTLDGVAVTVPLAPVPISVHPTPRLQLDYFLERDVFADDPHTDALEPSVPFSLAVLVQNKGAGVAKDFRITSAQPKVIENEKGLLVDFKIIATEVAGQNLTPTLTADFGTIGANSTAVARWLMTSTLQGLFIDYDATFEHVDGLGNPRLSLIDEVSIHEMIHLVQAGGAFADGKPDFLINEVPDLRDYPDTLFLSDGRTFPVEVVTNGTAGTPTPGSLQVQLTAALPGGWAYLRIPDPANGQYRLVSVRRSDSGVIGADNFWITDRTFLGQGKRPTRENILHLLDYNSTGAYTLTYEVNPALDLTPPSSAVAALPANSKANIPVNWSGQDAPGGGGIAFYDIYVSENAGPFQRWLWATLDTASIYQGNLGRTYAFYSVAVDTAGNREPAPPTPDAQTTVTLTNHPPVLAGLSNYTIVEGDTLSLNIAASDPDNDELTFSLLPGSPSGAVINPFSGLLTWVTGESHGPSTNPVTVQVLDNGAPRLGVFSSFNVVVLENNTAPVLAAIANRTINEGQLLTVTNVAQDFDLPPQTLSFRLGPGAPAGATINTNTGVFAWRPGDAQGGTTNTITIIVTDNGQPSGSATQSFTVLVRDTRPDLVLAIGTTAVLSGVGGSVPLTLHSGVDVTNLHLTLAISGDRVTNVNPQSFAAEVASVDFQPLGSNRFAAHFRSRSDALLQGNLLLAQLAFATVSNEHSAVTTITGQSLTGDRASSATPLIGNAGAGRVFIIGREPILDATSATNRQLALTVYGVPGERYALERRAPLMGPNDWTFDSLVNQNLLATLLPLRPALGGLEFFRASQVPDSELTIRVAGNQVILEWPLACAGCVLEGSAQLGAGAIWTPASQLPQAINGRYRVTIPIGASPRFYRLAVLP